VKSTEAKKDGAAGNSPDKNSIIAEICRVRDAIQEGNLSERANLVGVDTNSRILLFQINDLLDSIIKPLHMTARYIDDLSKGLIPPTTRNVYRGEFKVLADNLNAVVTIMTGLRDIAELEIVRKIFETRKTLTITKRLQDVGVSVAKAFNRIIASIF